VIIEKVNEPEKSECFKLRAQRVRRCLTQDRLALMSGVSLKRIRSFELGEGPFTEPEANLIREALKRARVYFTSYDADFRYTELEERLTDIFAIQCLSWRATPDHFITSDRESIPRWRFQPTREIAHTFLVLNEVAYQYVLKFEGGCYTAKVETASGKGEHSGDCEKTLVISLAIAEALRIPPENLRRRSMPGLLLSEGEWATHRTYSVA
jgi:transcriptional regulator with XRE-family HTH domain